MLARIFTLKSLLNNTQINMLRKNKIEFMRHLNVIVSSVAVVDVPEPNKYVLND